MLYCSIITNYYYVQHTISDIRELFVQMEKCIRELFIPAVIGRKVSDTHRKLFALPVEVRLGALGIINPVEAADKEYQTLIKVTEDLVDLINTQATVSLKTLDKIKVKAEALELAKETRLKAELSFVMSRLDAWLI